MKRVIILILFLIPSVTSHDVYEFGKDYWFEDENTIKTNTGWVFNIEEMMDYTVEGEVLGIRFYKEEKAPFGLVDVALAWGDVLKPEIKKNLEVKMEYRYCSYYYTPHDSEITFYYLRTHMSNNHLIPSTKEIFDKILEIKKGDYIRISGSLVYITGRKNMGDKIEKMEWGPSSTTLEDEGERACEIILVKSLEFLDQKSFTQEKQIPEKSSEKSYGEVWKYFIMIFIPVFLILSILSLRSGKKEEISPVILEYYTRKGYRVVDYTSEKNFLRLVISKDDNVYLVVINLKTGEISYKLMR